jgi:hypothetical protein
MIKTVEISKSDLGLSLETLLHSWTNLIPDFHKRPTCKKLWNNLICFLKNDFKFFKIHFSLVFDL